MSLEGALLREVAVVQRDKTLQQVRDAMARIPQTEYDQRNYRNTNLSAKSYHDALVRAIEQIRSEE